MKFVVGKLAVILLVGCFRVTAETSGGGNQREECLIQHDKHGMDGDKQEILEDFRVLTKTLDSFQSYGEKTRRGLIDSRRKNLEELRKDELTAKYIEKYDISGHLQELERRIQANQQLLQYIYQVGKANWADGAAPVDSTWSLGDENDQSKVQSTLKQLVREWSSFGDIEREQSYGVVMGELERRFPDKQKRHGIRVLVPGCGLARMPFELARRGFQAQGNEFSYHMLFTSNFMLNHTGGYAEQFRVYPYIHSFCNHETREYQLKEIRVPDIDPDILVEMMQSDSTIPDDGLMSMTAGSFTDIYPSEEPFDVITTVFFIDTSPNIAVTLKTIWETLKPGGLWINFGPLLWHYEHDPDMCGFELSMDLIIKDMVPDFGFEVLSHTRNNECRYSTSPFTKSGFVYGCDFWVARRPLE